MSHSRKPNKHGAYNVGRGKPPRKSQFKKGRSGNPKGRPKGSRNLANLFLQEDNRKIPVQINGVTKKLRNQDAFVKKIYAKALSGDLRAAQLMVNIKERMAENLPPEPDMTITASDVQLLRKYLPVLIEIANRDGGADDV